MSMNHDIISYSGKLNKILTTSPYKIYLQKAIKEKHMFEKNVPIALICVVALALAFSLYQEKKNEEVTQKKINGSFAELENIEQEAHKHPRQWFEIKIGKYDGRCRPAGSSARSDVDSYHAYASISDAKRSNEDFMLKYSMSGPYYSKIYTTSEDWCQKTIKANINQS